MISDILGLKEIGDGLGHKDVTEARVNMEGLDNKVGTFVVVINHPKYINAIYIIQLISSV